MSLNLIYFRDRSAIPEQQGVQALWVLGSVKACGVLLLRCSYLVISIHAFV